MALLTNTNPTRTMVPCATVKVQKTIDGLGYIVTKPDGTSTVVPLAIVDAFYTVPAAPTPLMDRPRGATVK